MARALGIDANDASGIVIEGVSTDTRTIAAGDLYVAIRGERFDGHRFVSDAFERGARAAVVADDAEFPADAEPPAGAGEGAAATAARPLLRVADTIVALQSLAAWYRARFDVKVIAVTGTNGKTTTKDMTAAALGTRETTLKTTGNLNNHIGLPLTLFGLEAAHDAAVVEMGMNHVGEIARLAALARPTIGIITNIAEAHIETMGDLDTIARAKAELLDALPANGTAVLNADDPRVMSQAGRAACDVVTFGLSDEADVRAVDVEQCEGCVRFRLPSGDQVELPTPGRHNVLNALAALAAAGAFGIRIDEAVRGLGRFETSPLRMRLEEWGGRTILNDAYNCNPSSLLAALRVLVEIARGRTSAAALGDMLELGVRSESAHRELGAAAVRLGITHLFLFGREVEALRDGALDAGMPPQNVEVFNDKASLAGAIEDRLPDDAVLLVKGSRGMRMEEVTESLTRQAPAC